jgi:predicted MPP superfamily phosphohydrolase
VVTRRKAIFSFLGACGVAPAYPCCLEPHWLGVGQHQVNLPRASFSEPLRLLQLSDLHYSPVVPLNLIESAVTLGLSQQPDLICLTGDFITHRDQLDFAAYSRTLQRLSAAAPTYAILGNHDGGRWARRGGGYADHRLVEKLLEQSGVELLHNRSIPLRIRNSRFSLVGVGDLWADEIDTARAYAGLDPRDPIVLMSHNPDSKDVLEGQPWDLMLSGHTHGGQVILPLVGAPFAPVVDKRYIAGLKPWGARQIHVTRGVGNLHGVRFGCRPEVSLLMLR